MKRIVGSHTERLPSLKLYLDDIERVVAILTETGGTVEIKAEGYLFDSIPDIATLKKETIRNLEIVSEQSRFSLSIRGRGWLHIAEDDPTSRGLFEQVKQLILPRRRLAGRFLRLGTLSGILTAVPLSLASLTLPKVLLAESPNREDLTIALAALLFLFAALIYAILAFREEWSGSSVINLSYRKDRPAFLARNKDRLAGHVIRAILSLLGGYVLALLTRH